MIDNLPALTTFARIVAAGSMSAAARELDLPLSVVSKRLAQLEDGVGVRLLQRTTRRQALTEEGLLLHARVLRILDEIAQAEQMLSQHRHEITGVLRLTAPGALGRQWIVPAVAEFQRLHPQLVIQLDLTDTVVDLLESGCDLALRYGSLPDSSLVARPLAANFRLVCAAPSYLALHGAPAHPSQLAAHRCIVMGDQRRADWRFNGPDGEALTVRVTGALVTNDGGAAHLLALDGAGLVVKSIWDVGDDILAGRLRPVLPGYSLSAAPLHAIMPHANPAPRVRAFVAFLGQRLGQIRRWDGIGKI